MYFIKENGAKVTFDHTKIQRAITKAMKDGGIYLPDIARLVAKDTKQFFTKKVGEDGAVSREQVEKYIFERLAHYGQGLTARSYEKYKTLRAYQKQVHETDEAILSLLSKDNDELMNENSNKRTTLISTQRDLIAGEINKSIARRKMLPAHLVAAHDSGILHIHDLDYYAQPMTNCCIVNLKDMLDNGTVINEVKIDSPSTFKTAANIATQIVAQIASSQFGGQSISTAHLAPYVRKSHERHLRKVREEGESVGLSYSDEQISKIALSRTKEEVAQGVQTIQYQLNTLGHWGFNQ